MARLTRAESQERTRRLLIESATKLFLRDGFRTTSLDAIGEEAGFSRGAVYSNFSSKGEIGIAVIDSLYESALQTVVTAVTAGDAEPGAWIDTMTAALQSSIGDPQWARLELEVGAAAQHDQIKASVAARYARLRSIAESVVTSLFAARNEAPPTDPQVIALAIVSFLLGFGIQRASDPSLPSQAIAPVMQLLVNQREPRNPA